MAIIIHADREPGGLDASEEAGQRTQKAFGPLPAREAPGASVAEVGGVNVYACLAVDGRNRRLLEHLCRYLARPPLCQERLERNWDGCVRYSPKKP